MQHQLFIGIDIGGSLSKIVVLSFSPLTLEQVQEKTIHLKQKQYTIYSKSFKNPLQSLNWLKSNIPETSFEVCIGTTGGGAAKYGKEIKQSFPKAKIQSINEFIALPKGLQFYKQSSLPITVHKYIQDIHHKFQQNIKQTVLKEIEIPIIMTSLGSGVSFHKIGQGPSGLERQKVEDPATSFDGYHLGGTSLGAAYIFGLISTLSGEINPDQIVKFLSQQSYEYQLYQTLMTNLMQSAINLSIIHKAPSIFVSGSILSIKRQLHRQFQKAIMLNIENVPIQRNLISLNQFQGYICAFGVIYSMMFDIL